MTPRVNREKFEKAPPEKKFRYSTKPRFPDEDWLRKYCSRRVGFTPGTGMTVPILVIARIRSVNRIFFLRSSILNMSEMVFDISTFLI